MMRGAGRHRATADGRARVACVAAAEESKRIFEQAVALEPGDADAWWRYGLLLDRDFRDLCGAEGKYRKALKAAPQVSRPPRCLAVAAAGAAQLRRSSSCLLSLACCCVYSASGLTRRCLRVLAHVGRVYTARRGSCEPRGAAASTKRR